jgi:hypothetical protein
MGGNSTTILKKSVLLKHSGFEGNTKTGGFSTTACPPTRFSMAGFPEGSLNSRVLGIVSIPAGVATTAGRSPGSMDKFRNIPHRQEWLQRISTGPKTGFSEPGVNMCYFTELHKVCQAFVVRGCNSVFLPEPCYCTVNEPDFCSSPRNNILQH